MGGSRLARMLTAAVVLLPATTLMGATLPVLVRARSHGGGAPGSIVARLYALNTSGAVVGSLATAFFFIPWMGLSGTVQLAAALNLIAALLVYSLWVEAVGREPRAAPTSSPQSIARPRLAPPRLLLLVSAALSGAGALGLEVLWARSLVLTTGSSTQAAALTLATFLGGIALGSAAYGRYFARVRAPALWAGAFQLLIAVSSVLLLRVAVALPYAYLALWMPLHGSAAGLVALRLLPAVALMLLPTFVMGAALPALIQAYSSTPRAVGRDVGVVYGVNTVGGVAGSLLVGLLLLPRLGVTVATLVAALAYLVAAVAAISASGSKGPRRVGWWLLVPGVLMVGAARIPAWDPIVMASGLSYLSQRWVPLRAQGGLEQTLDSFEVIYYEDGPEASVLVYASQEGQRAFVVNGRHEASTNPVDARNQYMLGHLPALLHRGPVRDGLVIALGSGMTAGTLARHADRVTVVELSREVLGAAALFGTWNHDVMKDPRVEIHIDDGRHFLRTTRASYDVITVDPIHPSVAGSETLYSREHHELVKSRLRPGGIAAQWLPLYQMPSREARTIAATFRDVFPDAQIWIVGPDAILIGGTDSRLPSALEIQQVMEQPSVRASLERVGMSRLATLLARYALGPAGLETYTRGVLVSTDDRPIIEFSLPWHTYDRTVDSNLLEIYQDGGRALAPSSLAGLTSDDIRQVLEAREGVVFDRFALQHRLAGNLAAAFQTFEAALLRDPDGPLARNALNRY
jgi:spermidine synthase